MELNIGIQYCSFCNRLELWMELWTSICNYLGSPAKGLLEKVNIFQDSLVSVVGRFLSMWTLKIGLSSIHSFYLNSKKDPCQELTLVWLLWSLSCQVSTCQPVDWSEAFCMCHIRNTHFLCTVSIFSRLYIASESGTSFLRSCEYIYVVLSLFLVVNNAVSEVSVCKLLLDLPVKQRTSYSRPLTRFSLGALWLTLLAWETLS